MCPYNGGSEEECAHKEIDAVHRARDLSERLGHPSTRTIIYTINLRGVIDADITVKD